MLTPAAVPLAQDQNKCDGSLVAGGKNSGGSKIQRKRRKNNGSKAQNKGGNLAGRKSLDEIKDDSDFEIMFEGPYLSPREEAKEILDSILGRPKLPPGCYEVIRGPGNDLHMKRPRDRKAAHYESFLKNFNLEDEKIDESCLKNIHLVDFWEKIDDDTEHSKMMTEDESDYARPWWERPSVPSRSLKCELRESPVMTKDLTPGQSKEDVDFEMVAEEPTNLNGGNLAGRKSLDEIKDDSDFEIMFEGPYLSPREEAKEILDSILGRPKLPPGCYEVIRGPGNDLHMKRPRDRKAAHYESFLKNFNLEDEKIDESCLKNIHLVDLWEKIDDDTEHSKMMTEDESDYAMSWWERPSLPPFP